MFSRFGLRFRMAVSYVLVSAAALLLVEGVVLAVTVTRIRAADAKAQQAQERAIEAEADVDRVKTESFANVTATVEGNAVSLAATHGPGRTDEALLDEAASDGVGDPDDERREDNGPAKIVRVLATTGGRVIASTPVGAFPRDSTLPATAIGALHSGQTRLNDRGANWATKPVQLAGLVGGEPRIVGLAYVVLETSDPASDRKPRDGGSDLDTVSLLTPAVVILVLLLPVGGLFGLFSTGRLIRRIRRLSQRTAAMADGDLKSRIPVSGGDEIGRLEQAFNAMAERLDTAVDGQRRAAGAQAQQAERARLARELHDSISQHLFSASLIAGGLRKALAPDSELRHQAESVEASLARTMREMRAMLLELRPIALEEAGLADALDELCRAYAARLGISVSVQLDEPLRLAPAVEHAVFRVVQESLGNAIRHGEPDSIELRIAAGDSQVAVTVRDDGHGFDPHVSTRHGLGLQLMRERISELGGTMTVVSAPQRGTTVAVLLPVQVPVVLADPPALTGAGHAGP
jgi:signal transduction histidine kinase